MADTKISALVSATTPLTGAELIPVVQSSSTKKTTLLDVQQAPVSSGTANAVVYLNGSKVPSSNSAFLFDGANLLINATTTVNTGRTVSKSVTGGNPYVAWNPSTSGTNGFISFGTETTFTERGYIYYDRAAGQTKLSATSDQRLKENIEDAPSVLELISKLKVRKYNWRETGSVNIGFIAQELHEVVERAVWVGEDNEDGSIKRPWSVDNGTLIPYLVKAIQEQQELIQSMASRIKTLEISDG